MKKPPKKGEPTKEQVLQLRRDNRFLTSELRKANKTAIDAIQIAEQSQNDFRSLKGSYESLLETYRKMESSAENMIRLNERLLKMLEDAGVSRGSIEKLN